MAIRWWDPMTDLLQTHRMMDRVFEQVFGSGGTTAAQGAESQTPTYYLPLDILESDEAYVLTASVPGFSPEQVEVSFQDGVLSIQATAEPFVPTGRWVRRERAYGNLVRRLELPQQIEGGKISAAFDNGLLTITVPKAAKPEPVKIAVAAPARQKQLAARS
jgi:HSP20 family protein